MYTYKIKDKGGMEILQNDNEEEGYRMFCYKFILKLSDLANECNKLSE